MLAIDTHPVLGCCSSASPWCCRPLTSWPAPPSWEPWQCASWPLCGRNRSVVTMELPKEQPLSSVPNCVSLPTVRSVIVISTRSDVLMMRQRMSVCCGETSVLCTVDYWKRTLCNMRCYSVVLCSFRNVDNSENICFITKVRIQITKIKWTYWLLTLQSTRILIHRILWKYF